jgi:ABC-type transport system substrate-binding protein
MNQPRRTLARTLIPFLLASLSACSGVWNSPYPRDDDRANILYSRFTERPKQLDPARAYNANEYTFIAQIYEPPLQYHFLKKPYALIPLTATEVPTPRYLDADGREIADPGPGREVAYSVYDIHIKPGIYYQPHPAFATDGEGRPLYDRLRPEDLKSIDRLSDFPRTGTRELVAADYVYEIKRFAHPRLNSPILGVMGEYIVGLREYAARLREVQGTRAKEAGDAPVYIDLTQYPLEGAQVIDRYTYRIKIKGRYPQLLYWLAMPFFAPMPPEVDRFHTQPGMAEKNLTLDWYPVGTGPYMLTVNNPNRQMVMERNPNFHEELYPSEGMPGDREAGLLRDAGKRLPFIDKIVLSLEKEDIPYWNKFLQGYYDVSGVASDSFDQAIRFGPDGKPMLSEQMSDKGIRLQTAVSPSIFYTGFNMLDPVVGGYSERQRLLRQAISIAFDDEEFVSIFANGRGVPAQGPIPPGIFGHREGEAGINPVVYQWANGGPRRRPLDEARRLLRQAGYGGGIDQRTGRPLVLNLDITAGGLDDRARLDWFRKQLQKLDIQLVIRNTDYNRFQDKMQSGNAQIFMWGWNADYPDPENFLFLLYGPNGKVKYHGENAANYQNAEFDRLFDRMKNMPDGPERAAIIDRMTDIVRRDAPWLWGFHPISFSLYHAWYSNAVPNLIANNTLKYRRIDPELRARLRAEWNRPALWPFALLALLVIAFVVPALMLHLRRQHRAPALGAPGG